MYIYNMYFGQPIDCIQFLFCWNIEYLLLKVVEHITCSCIVHCLYLGQKSQLSWKLTENGKQKWRKEQQKSKTIKQ